MKAIHAKIANRRKDALHKFSRRLVNRSGEIYVGNVKSSSLAKNILAVGHGHLEVGIPHYNPLA